jgi:hypothetical protein
MRAAFPEIPEEADNDVREDGTAAHWLANEIWHGRVPPVDSLSPNGRLMDEEMFDSVDLYHSTLRSFYDGSWIIEQPVSMKWLHPELNDGTPDAWAFDPSTYTLYVVDLKYGFRFVEVWFNWQLICYVRALIETLNLDDTRLRVVMCIVQPRSHHREGPVRKQRLVASDLRAYANVLISRAAAAMQPETECVPNPGCVECPGRHACMALQNAALTALETAYSSVPLELDALAIGDELKRLKDAQKKLEARVTGLTMQAESTIKKGGIIPGWMLAPTFARERWRDDVESQVLTLGVLYGVDLARPRKPVTPAQAKKLLPADVVKMYSHTPSTGVRLTQQGQHEVRKKFSQQE